MNGNELDRPTEEPKPTPQELKSRIVLLCEQLPFPPPLESENNKGRDLAFNTLIRRIGSEHKRKLLPILGELLEQARPYTTRSFRRSLREEFISACELGVDRENHSDDNILGLLGVDFPDRNSLYDKELVPVLERRGYRKSLAAYLSIEHAITSDRALQRVQTQSPELYEDYLNFFVFNRKEDPWVKELKRWRQKYIERWGDEP